MNELERRCLEAYRAGRDPSVANGDSLDDWISFGLGLLLFSGRLVREHRMTSLADAAYKADGSPVTQMEKQIELELARRLRGFDRDASIVGEETGGELPRVGIGVAVDPIDGTWSFLGRTETVTTVMAVFRDGKPFLGLIGNPATGEIGYATRGGEARLLQLPVFGEETSASTLPMPRLDRGETLVNLHPGPNAGPLSGALYEEWREGRISMIKSPGGSPSWALLEAAKGTYVYANLWGKRRAAAYDLAAGLLLVEAAGGRVADLNDEPIDPVHHEGPFVAAVDEAGRHRVIEIVRSVRDT